MVNEWLQFSKNFMKILSNYKMDHVVRTRISDVYKSVWNSHFDYFGTLSCQCRERSISTPTLAASANISSFSTLTLTRSIL